MRKTLVLILLVTGLGAAQAQTGMFKTFSLKQAVEYGVQNNISAKNAKLSETEAQAKNKELLSIGLPQLNANFDYTYYLVRPISPAFSEEFGSVPAQFASLLPKKFYVALANNVSTGVNLSQLVYDTRFFIGIKTFKSLIKVSQLTTALTEQDIKYNIIKGYSDAQAAKEIIRVLDSNLVIIDKLLHDTRETYNQGLIEETDVNRLELGESQLKSQINNTHNLYDLAMASLKYNMGLQLTDKIALTDNIDALRAQISSDAPATFDPSQRIESDLLNTAIMLKNFDRQQRKAGYYPSIYGLANFGGGSQVDYAREIFEKQHHSDGTTTSNWYMQSYVGFTLKVPLYDGGQKEASVKQAKIELEKSKNDLENFKNQSSLQVEAAKTTFTTNLIEEQNAKQSMDLNDKIFYKTRVKFKEGVGSSFELMQTQQDRTSNQIKYFTAVRNVIDSRADLDKALGIR
jgi:outer membrane protein TolC